jgi:hypothetical protein
MSLQSTENLAVDIQGRMPKILWALLFPTFYEYIIFDKNIMLEFFRFLARMSYTIDIVKSIEQCLIELYGIRQEKANILAN